MKLNQGTHNFLKKTSVKVTALARFVKLVPFKKKKLLVKSFIELYFSCCPLIRMFFSRGLNRKINERASRLVYEDYTITFDELLRRDKTICIHHQNIQKVAIEMFKVKNNTCPEMILRLRVHFHRQNVN